jgi:hypothetical protein
MALKTVEIGSGNLDQAIQLLDKGFPVHGAAFWRSMLARVKQMHKRQSIQSLGDLLLHGDKPVGVLLKIQHRSPIVPKPIINLSSWYVEPDFRWYAPHMLLKATADKNSIYTDLSPSPEVYSINERIGFRTISSGQLLFPLPLTSLLPSSKAKIFALSDIQEKSLQDDLHHFVMTHHADNSETLVIDDGNGLHPVMFQIRKRRGLNCANLIYAENIKELQRHSVRVARHLLMRGIAFMTMPAVENQRAAGSFMLNSFKPHQVKGEWKENMVDQTYSEAILLPYQI